MLQRYSSIFCKLQCISITIIFSLVFKSIISCHFENFVHFLNRYNYIRDLQLLMACSWHAVTYGLQLACSYLWPAVGMQLLIACIWNAVTYGLQLACSYSWPAVGMQLLIACIWNAVTYGLQLACSYLWPAVGMQLLMACSWHAVTHCMHF